MSSEEAGGGSSDATTGAGQPTPPPPPAGDQVVEIDFNPLVGKGGGVDSFRNEMPNPDVETSG